jgi:hypothetical protein
MVRGSRKFAPHVAAFVGATLGGLASARAQTSAAIELAWVAPAGCPSARSVREEALRLARVSHLQDPLRARGSIEEHDGVWHLQLVTEFRGGIGERHLSASSCQALSEATELVLALILNPDVEVDARPQPGERKAAPAARAEPEAHRSPLRLLGSAHAGVHSGVLRAVGAEFGVGLGLIVRPISIRATLGASLPETAHVSGGAGPGGRVWFLGADITGCWEIPLRAAFAGPCAGLGVTRMQGHGVGVQSPQSGAAFWASGLLGAGAGLRPTPSLAVRISGFALLPTQRPSLFLEDLGVVERPREVGALGRLGVELSWP